MKAVLFILVLLALSVLMLNVVEARICIPNINLPECQPKDGTEPPAWCGDGPLGIVGHWAEEFLGKFELPFNDIFWWAY